MHCSQGSVAQLVEQRTSNPKVVGSNPTWATEFNQNNQVKLWRDISWVIPRLLN